MPQMPNSKTDMYWHTHTRTRCKARPQIRQDRTLCREKTAVQVFFFYTA